MRRIAIEAIKTTITDFASIEGYCIKSKYAFLFDINDINISYRGCPFTELKVFKMSFVRAEIENLYCSWGQIELRL